MRSADTLLVKQKPSSHAPILDRRRCSQFEIFFANTRPPRFQRRIRQQAALLVLEHLARANNLCREAIVIHGGVPVLLQVTRFSTYSFRPFKSSKSTSLHFVYLMKQLYSNMVNTVTTMTQEILHPQRLRNAPPTVAPSILLTSTDSGEYETARNSRSWPHTVVRSRS